MKKRLLFLFICVVLAVSAAMTGCSKSTTGPTTPTPTTTVVLSANVFRDIAYTTPVPNLTVTVYEVDATAARIGTAIATTSTNVSGAFSITVTINKYYEVALSDGTSIMHVYLPQVTAAKSGINLLYTSFVGASSMVTDGFLMFIYNSGMIASADSITLDGGSNLNDSTVSPGTYNMVELFSFGFGNQGGLIDTDIAESASGTTHTLTYKGAARKVRVFMLTTYHGTCAVFY